MTTINILSIDASTTCTGYSKLTYDPVTFKYKHIETDSIKSSKKNIYDRMNFILESLESNQILQWCDTAVFENYAFNGNRVSQLAEFNGCIKMKLHLLGKTIELVSPNTIKKVVTGHGHAKKPKVREDIKKIPEFINVNLKNNDESDSLAVGYTYIQKLISVQKPAQ